MKFFITNPFTIIRQAIARLTSEEQGQGMVEMALVLLFFFPLTFGMIDAGRCVYAHSVVQAAAQEGARAGIVDGADIHTAVESMLIGLDLDNAQIDINNTDVNIISVSISYDFVFVTPMVEAFVSSLSLTSTASMVIM